MSDNCETDPAKRQQFGNRLLEADSNVFQHNAWYDNKTISNHNHKHYISKKLLRIH